MAKCNVHWFDSDATGINRITYRWCRLAPRCVVDLGWQIVHCFLQAARRFPGASGTPKRYPKNGTAMIFRKLFGKHLAPGPELKQIFQRLEDDLDGRDSLQYAIVDAYLSLRSQAHRDGWLNWSDWYEECLDLLSAHIPNTSSRDANEVRSDLEVIREAGRTGADEGRFGYDELDRLAPDIIRWYKRNKNLICLPNGADSWFETLKTTEG